MSDHDQHDHHDYHDHHDHPHDDALLSTARHISPPSSFAPSAHAAEEAKLPSGQCRFILLRPAEVKGQRCPCVGFARNQSVPGGTCECGHMSCYHIRAQPPPETVSSGGSTTLTSSEIDLLRRRVQQLEQQLGCDGGWKQQQQQQQQLQQQQIRQQQQQIEALSAATARIEGRMANAEEQAERDRDEARQDLRACYRNVSRVWESVDQLGRAQAAQAAKLATAASDERLDDLENWLQRVSDQVGECNEASISLEERVDELEENAALTPTLPAADGAPPGPATSDESGSHPYLSPRSNPRLSHSLPGEKKVMAAAATNRDSDTGDGDGDESPGGTIFATVAPPIAQVDQEQLPPSWSGAACQARRLPSRITDRSLGPQGTWVAAMSNNEGSISTAAAIAAAAPTPTLAPAQEWTVHVSLLPVETQPFPFEKDTTAYKRCLSRGLHRMVAVGGRDSASFVRVVSRAFEAVLRGRAWAPLQTRLCDAEPLQGLPMLRPLADDQSSSTSSSPSLPRCSDNRNYNYEFLREHCAIPGPDGKVESLYIAMINDSLSWHFLRGCPVHLEGLESSWQFDPVLDRSDGGRGRGGGGGGGGGDGPDPRPAEDDNARSAGDILVPLPKATASTAVKRPAPASGDAGGGSGLETSRAAKVQRTGCIAVPMGLATRHGVKGRVETS